MLGAINVARIVQKDIEAIAIVTIPAAANIFTIRPHFSFVFTLRPLRLCVEM